MEIVWGNGNRKMNGIEGTEMYVGGGKCVRGRESLKELGSFPVLNHKCV